MEKNLLNSYNYRVLPAESVPQVIKAYLPKKERFMVHSTMPMDVYVTYFDGNWHVVNAEIVARGVFVPGLLQGYLYPAVTESGRPFVLVVTKPLSVATTSWFSAWQEIIEIAKHKFVEVIPNHNQGRHDYLVANGQDEPLWPALDAETWLMMPFATHAIESEDHAIFARRKESYYPDESDNEFEE